MKWSKWVIASSVAMSTVGGAAAAQPSATDAELQQYASMYWHLIDTGTPHPDAATFQFADPGMNLPGAYPFAGALALFNNVYSSKINPDATQCESYKDVIDLIAEDADVAAKFRVYTTSKEFTTSDALPLVNEKHFWAVIDALGGGNEYTLDGINFIGAVTTPGWWPNPLPPAAWPAPWACRTIPPTGVSPATCICSQTRNYQRPVLRCFLGICWTRIQHAVETEVCSTTGPCPPGGPVPGPVCACRVTHQVFP